MRPDNIVSFDLSSMSISDDKCNVCFDYYNCCCACNRGIATLRRTRKCKLDSACARFGTLCCVDAKSGDFGSVSGRQDANDISLGGDRTWMFYNGVMILDDSINMMMHLYFCILSRIPFAMVPKFRSWTFSVTPYRNLNFEGRNSCIDTNRYKRNLHIIGSMMRCDRSMYIIQYKVFVLWTVVFAYGLRDWFPREM